MTWTPERVELLSQLWSSGLPTAQIGKQLGITKNAVVGKAHRIGLPERQSPISVVKKPAKVVEMSAHTCRWPEGHPGEPGFHFCAKPIVSGKPYCAEHAARAYHRPTRRDNAA